MKDLTNARTVALGFNLGLSILAFILVVFARYSSMGGPTFDIKVASYITELTPIGALVAMVAYFFGSKDRTNSILSICTIYIYFMAYTLTFYLGWA